MRDLSPEMQELIERLTLARRRPLLDAASVRELIVRIAEACTPTAAAHLLPFTFSPDAETARTAARAIRRLLETLAPRDHVWLDEDIRRIHGSYRWDWPLAPGDLAHLAQHGEDAPWLFGVTSFHPSGFVRQEAIARLRGSGTAAVPFLLVRANDWVGPVRDAAVAAIRERLEPAQAPAFVQALPLVFRLEHTARASHLALVSAVQGLLSRPAAGPAVRAGLLSPHQEVRQLCRQLLLVQEPARSLEILSEALRDPDPRIRLWAARIAADLPEPRDLLHRMARDRAVAVRGLALRTLAERNPAEAGDLLEQALFDLSPSIRQEARWRLTRGRTADFAPRYRQALEPGSPLSLQGALGGLGETGQAQDTTRVLPFLAHPTARVRRTALRALGKLTPANGPLEAIEGALRDPAPSVAAEARKILASRGGLVDPERLWRLFIEDERPHVRENVLLLLASLGKWDRLLYLLRACGDRAPRIASLSRHLIERWLFMFNRSFATPAPAQLQRIEEALEQNGHALAPTMRRGVELSLATFHR